MGNLNIRLIFYLTLSVFCGCRAQFCTSANGFACVSPVHYVPCANFKLDLTTQPSQCPFTDGPVDFRRIPTHLCHGSGTTAAEICRAAPCPSGGAPSNFSLLTAPPYVYYTCVTIGTQPPIQTPFMQICYNSLFVNTTRTCAGDTQITCSEGRTFAVDPSSCNHYYICRSNSVESATRTRCPSKMRFDSVELKCRIRYATTCGNRPELITLDFKV